MRSKWLLALVMMLIVNTHCANAMVEDTALALHKNCRFLIIALVYKGWLTIAKLKPLSLLNSLLLMLKKAFDNFKIEK